MYKRAKHRPKNPTDFSVGFFFFIIAVVFVEGALLDAATERTVVLFEVGGIL